MRPPTAANAPQIAIGPTGNGVVVWQEPDITGVARIWARRLFGRSLDYVLPVSAASFAGTAARRRRGRPERRDLPTRRRPRSPTARPPEPGSPLPGPRIFLNTLPDGESADGSQFAGANVADSAVSGGGVRVGRPAERRHRRKAAPASALRQQRTPARDRGQRSRSFRRRCRSGLPSRARNRRRRAS